METIPSKETFFIQCNRTNSLIDKDLPEQNSSWTTNIGTGDFNLMAGDVIFVDRVSLEVLGAEDSDSTLSFTATNAIQNGVAGCTTQGTEQCASCTDTHHLDTSGLHSGSNPTRFPKYWNNILFGNRFVKNIYREWCGDVSCM